MRLPRASGILLHPTSLPSRFGIGDLGPTAERFLDMLAATGQRWWQMLPLGPTGFGNSPYQSYSSYAGNRLLISPELLAAEGWLTPDDWRDYPDLPADTVDYDAVKRAKDPLLQRAFERFDADTAVRPDFEAFRRTHASWLDDYTLYIALKETHQVRPWYEWEPEFIVREPEALAHWRERLADRIRYHEFVQFVFDRQWNRLRELCRARNIGLIGDLPIFVALDSADVWSRPELFELDEARRPTVVAGVPPDFFSASGQLWGNPLYRWPVHEAEHFAWWIGRLQGTTRRVDLVRLDHFRGFEAYWEIPAGSETAASGRWALGPGARFFQAVRHGLGALPLIAEDLGEITFEVEALRDKFDLPGMRVLHFAFGDDPKAEDYLPYRHINHCLIYTGTHDNDTTVGWYRAAEGTTTQTREQIEAERAFLRRYLGTDGSEIHWDLIRWALGSVADTAIVPLQDVLGLDSSARMNTPGTPTGNWRWRFRFEQFDPATRDRLADLTAVYGRWNGTVPPHLRSPRKESDAWRS